MSRQSVIVFTTGCAGSGKSYRRCPRFIVDEFLPNRKNKKSRHISNFPILVEALAECASRKMKISVDEVKDSIEIIPNVVMDEWRAGNSGPWDYFKDKSIDGCHIAIDECHNFFGRRHKADHLAKLQGWLGEIRHRGACVEFITQHPMKVAKEIGYEAVKRLEIMTMEDVRDPWFGIPMDEWYELEAKVTGEYRQRIIEVERVERFGRWVKNGSVTNVMDPQYFKCYDSWSAPVQGGGKADGVSREYERRSVVGLVGWFCKRNWLTLGVRFLMCSFVVFLLCGGGKKMVTLYLNGINKVVANNENTRGDREALVETTGEINGESSGVVANGVGQEESQAAEIGSNEDSSDEEISKNPLYIVRIDNNSVSLSNGFYYRIGEQVETKGRIIGIDFFSRSIRFEDKSKMYMLSSH